MRNGDRGPISRRRFIGYSGVPLLAAWPGILGPGLRAEEEAPQWKPGDPVGYITPKIPEFDLPPYEGETYEATVPDTLDLAERARLAVNGLTEPTNPLADYEIYSIVYFRTNPPSMMQNCWHPLIFPKFMWAVSMMRLMTGSEQNLQVERRWMEVALKMQGPDGLIYTPVKGRPWTFVWWQILDVEVPKDQILQPYACASTLTALAHLAKRDPGGVWKTAMRRLVDGMVELAVVDGDLAYYWPSCIVATKERPPRPPVPTRPFDCEGTIVVHGLVRAYNVLRYEPALVLARKYINYLRQSFYGPDGSFRASPTIPAQAHFHAHARGLLAMEEYAEAAGDKELMRFVVQAFELARDQGSNFRPGVSHYDLVRTPGAGLLGFFPEWANSPVRQTSETCQVGDMIVLALRLSEAGEGDYWDDADRWIRNQLVENQLVETDWVSELGKKVGDPLQTGNHVTTDRVAERNRGAFAGSPSPNEWHSRDSKTKHALGHCCTVNGSKTLFWAWERILRYRNGKLKVNLLLNRASRWADVESYIPYEGRVQVKVKQPLELSLRIPEWVAPEQASCEVDGQERKLGWNGRYAKVGNVAAGSIVSLTFPISERTEVVWVEKRRYKIVRKGNEVVSIDPPGIDGRLYQREHYRADRSRMRKVTRFVSSEMSS